MKILKFILWAALLAFPLILSAGEIHDAAQQGDLAAVQQLTANNPDLLTAPNPIGSTPIHIAAVNGHKDIVEYLLSKGVPVDLGDRENSTPLMVAAQGGHKNVVDLLIANGADVKAEDINDMTPLLFAAWGGNKDIFDLFVSKGADINDKSVIGMTTLHYAVYNGHIDIAKYLVQHGIDVNVKKVNLSTPLHGAALDGHLEMIEFLLSNGAEVDAKNQAGYTPFLSAIAGGQLETAKLLISKGADPTVKLNDGETALIAAVIPENENLDLIRMLIDKGVDVNAVTDYGMTALLRASWWGKTDIAHILIANGANVNFKSNGRVPAIFGAAQGGHADFVKLLIDNNAKVNVKDENGASPLMAAIVQGHDQTIKILLDYGAGTKYKEKHYGRTALHIAAIKGNKEAVGMLLAHDAQINAKDNTGNTPLNLAAKYGNKDVAQLLITNGAVANLAMEDNFGNCPYLKEQFADNKAMLWYLGHCGWAVKTSNHLLIFDYWNRGKTPAQPCLANGHINPDELADLDVHVFITHEHRDHYDTTIFDWADKVKNITYIYGFRPEALPQHRESGYNGPEYTYLGPRDHAEIDDMDIMTIDANDAGVGFLIKVDGVTLYHAGDHAGWQEGEREGYISEIDYLSDHVRAVDIAFLNITGCHAHGPEPLWEGNCYTIDQLNPSVVIPTHAIDREYLYKEFSDRLKKENGSVEVYCPENKGDRFRYEAGKSI